MYLIHRLNKKNKKREKLGHEMILFKTTKIMKLNLVTEKTKSEK